MREGFRLRAWYAARALQDPETLTPNSNLRESVN